MISIDSGDYADFDELAVEIESQINADTALASVGATVNVSYDSVNNLDFYTHLRAQETKAKLVCRRLLEINKK